MANTKLKYNELTVFSTDKHSLYGVWYDEVFCIFFLVAKVKSRAWNEFHTFCHFILSFSATYSCLHSPPPALCCFCVQTLQKQTYAKNKEERREKNKEEKKKRKQNFERIGSWNGKKMLNEIDNEYVLYAKKE